MHPLQYVVTSLTCLAGIFVHYAGSSKSTGTEALKNSRSTGLHSLPHSKVNINPRWSDSTALGHGINLLTSSMACSTSSATAPHYTNCDTCSRGPIHCLLLFSLFMSFSSTASFPASGILPACYYTCHRRRRDTCQPPVHRCVAFLHVSHCFLCPVSFSCAPAPIVYPP
jgi:hypothetical protein